MKRMRICALIGAAMGLLGCIDPGEPVYGASFTDAHFEVYDPTVGIHPNETVLDDPNNPFAYANSGRDTRFEIEANDQSNVTAFYSWASWLAREPTGEAQFYVGVNLFEIWESGNASQEDLRTIRFMAAVAFNTVLEEFPDAATFDETGTTRIELLTPSYFYLEGLTGAPPPGWVLVEDAQGIPRAVRQ